jgi:hypothetical protein
MATECAGWSALGLVFVPSAPPQTGLVLLATLVAVAAVSVDLVRSSDTSMFQTSKR